MRKRYKINLTKQLAAIGKKKNGKTPVYFSFSLSSDKRIKNHKRAVLVLELSDKVPAWRRNGHYKVNSNGSIELPTNVIKLITHNENGDPVFRAITAIDDEDRKIIVPFLDEKGDF